MFDLRERHAGSESHRIRVIHSYIGDDDDEPWKESREGVEDERPKVRRLGEERENVAIIIDSGIGAA